LILLKLGCIICFDCIVHLGIYHLYQRHLKRNRPAQLQIFVAEDDRSIEVINSGIGSSTSDYHLKMIGSEIIEYEPDLILYYAGRNDHAICATERYPGPDLWPIGMINYFKAWVIYKKAQITIMFILHQRGIN